MKNFNDFKSKIEFVLTDIDDTLTTDGELRAQAYDSLWKLHNAGLKIIPITGRPAGWCEMIARFWPVDGVVGENGGFYFRYTALPNNKNKKMKRWFAFSEDEIKKNQHKLQQIQNQILTQVPEAAISSDQFCRLMDLAVDFCEDIPRLNPQQISQIVDLFHQQGAQAKISSIHVNGWFGDYNKVSTALIYLKNEHKLTLDECLDKSVFIGDSPNDEPMFEKFPHSVGVANIKKFATQLQFKPAYVTDSEGGQGFSEFANHLLKKRETP